MMNKPTLDQLQARNPEFTNHIARGVEALHAGKRQAARRTFARAVRADPHNATAWFWLSRALDDDEQRAYCVSRVEALDGIPTEHPTHAASPRSRRSIFPRRLWPMVALLIILSLLCAATPFPIQPAARATNREQRLSVPLASGVIRAHEVTLASEYGGLVQQIATQAGQAVSADQVLIELDTSFLDAQIEAASAVVSLAEANLARAKAGARKGQIAIAEAQLAKAQAARMAAAQGVTDTARLVYHPQEIQLQLDVTESQIAAAGQKLAEALALKDAAEVGKDAFQEAQEAIHEAGGPGKRRIRVKIASGSLSDLSSIVPPEILDQIPTDLADGVYTFGEIEIEIHNGSFAVYRWVQVNLNLPFEAHLAPNVWWQAWIGVNAAAAEKRGLETSQQLLHDRLANPQDQRAQLDQARAALAQANAQIKAAEVQIRGLEEGASAEQITALQARVREAKTARDALITQRDQMTIRSPIDGIVIDIIAHPGEVAAQGAPLLTVATLDTLQLTVYLPESRLGQITLGQQVAVSVDSFPDRTFTGTVTYIADKAEFTPRNIATKEERVNLVFAVDIELDNEDGALKPGMPADARFGGEQ
jgi:multidrug resistance efflux pump